MPTTLEPTVVRDPDVDERVAEDHPWVVIVWNDPVNLMSYVTHVLQKLFGYSLEKATELMLDVHHEGKAVVANGTREQAEMHVFRLHEHGLYALFFFIDRRRRRVHVGKPAAAERHRASPFFFFGCCHFRDGVVHWCWCG